LAAFRPDVFLVDKVPTGAVGELAPVLEDLRERGDVRCVLGLPDILDDPQAVRSEWRRLAYPKAIDEFYDAVWVYGDRNVYDVVEEYDLPETVASKVRYTGYFDRSSDAAHASMPFKGGTGPDRYVLCLLGGGQDGDVLAEAFAGAEFPTGFEGVVLTGPFLSQPMRERLRRSVSRRPHIHVLDFLSEPSALIQRAEKVIAMGGYNTVSEVLGHERPLLIVPRVEPRSEQWIRARRLSELGVVDYLVPEEARSDALSAWMRAEAKPPSEVRTRIDYRGLQRLPVFVGELMCSTARASGLVAR
jgi:predicted glycosyltransferase